MVGRRSYDLMYRVHAPWEGGPRDELVELVTSGRLTPSTLSPGRAVDLGCGSGPNAIFLARHGFDVVGVDFSPVGLAKARRAAALEPDLRLRFVEGDLTAPAISGLEGPFDLLVDSGTLDDLPRGRRPAMAATIRRLAGPTAVVVLWCFYDEVAWWRRRGARYPGLAPGEEATLFGDAFTIERLHHPPAGSGFACFVMTRR
jgi:SAM-dependent methyltransferase